MAKKINNYFESALGNKIDSILDAMCSVPFIDYVYGRARANERIRNGKKYRYPGFYIGNGEYEDMLPLDSRGHGYAFIMLDDPIESINYVSFETNKYKVGYSLIVWYKEGTSEMMDIDLCKDYVLGCLKLCPNVTVEKIYEKYSNVFSGFSCDEIDTQYLMWPWNGFKITGEITYNEPCK